MSRRGGDRYDDRGRGGYGRGGGGDRGGDRGGGGPPRRRESRSASRGRGRGGYGYREGGDRGADRGGDRGGYAMQDRYGGQDAGRDRGYNDARGGGRGPARDERDRGGGSGGGGGDGRGAGRQRGDGRGGTARREDEEESGSESQDEEPAQQPPQPPPPRRPAAAPAREEPADDGDDDDDEEEEEEEEAVAPSEPPPRKTGDSAPPAKPASQPSSGTLTAASVKANSPPLVVSGCKNETISDIIAGTYLPDTVNHGKVVYKRSEKSRGLDVLIYYWDDRDGPELCGWWFGPSVGGDQVWAYHPSRTAGTPPASEWNVPHDGDIDPSFSVTANRNISAADLASRQDDEMAPRRSRGQPQEPPPSRRTQDRDDRRPADDDTRRDRSRGRGDDRDSGRAGSRGPPPQIGASSNYFMDAYNRRREERAKAEEDKKRGEDTGHRRDEGSGRGDSASRRDDRGGREEEARVRRIQEMKAQMEREAEEEKRQMEDIKRRTEERRSRPDFTEKPKPKATEEEPRSRDRRDEDRQEHRRDERQDQRQDQRGRGREDRDRPLVTFSVSERDRNRDEDRRDRRDSGGGRDEDRRRQLDEERQRKHDEDRKREDDRKRGEEDKRRRQEEDDRDRKRRREEDDRRNDRRDDRNDRKPEERRQEDPAERERRQREERERREEEKKKKEEDMRRREEELQKKREERRRKEDEERRKVEDSKKDERAEERRKNELRRQVEEERVKEEAERKRREDWKKHEDEIKQKTVSAEVTQVDEAKRRDEEAKVLRQQQATLSVLRVLQKLSNASPENFESMNKELEETLATELPETGAQQEILKAEADRVLEYAKQYVEQVREQQKKWEEDQKNKLERQKEQEDSARALVEELRNLATAAEAESEAAHYTAAPLAGEHEMETIEVLKICRKVEKAGKAATEACARATEFLTSKTATINEAENIRSETSLAVSQVQPRITAASRQASDALTKAKENKEKIAKKIMTAKRAEKKDALFKKYDKDGDGVLNMTEIMAYAKGEHDFELPAENKDRIMKQLCRGNKGLGPELLQLLKSAVGIARDEAVGKVKRVARLERERIEREEREKREAELSRRKAEYSTEIKALMAELEELEPKVREADSLTESMVHDANAGKIKEAEEAKSRQTAIDTLVHATHAKISEVQLRGQTLSTKIAEDKDVVEMMARELAALGTKTESQDMALRKALASAGQARQLALNRAFALYETLRMEVAAKLRVCIETQGGKPDDLYDAIATAGGGKVTRSSIKAYLESNQSDIEPEKLENLWPNEAVKPAAAADAPNGDDAKKSEGEKKPEGDEKKAEEKEKAAEEESEISRESFMRVVRIFYKVVKEIVLSDNLLIEQSEQLRRMDVGEVMEVFQGPMLDPSVGVYRIHGRALKDGIMGWVTVAGNQGITFLMPGGNLMRVARAARLTDTAQDVEGESGVRQLSEGDILEVIAWERINVDTPSAVTRIKAKVQGETAVGWTSITEGGVANLEVV
eukprot:TRINITY_DN60257_c0_g1_i1.p1 TRINITY_DN60257_c0_g1~~TRINITY_DN60257_c0_g1_i1.p1  ORF type:complete len:1494 (+),score=434.52 TRINITY_DN60257_c0_g1_i1:52-4533(+)